jgi:diguanylate cyclase (GGDEF)-like protein
MLRLDWLRHEVGCGCPRRGYDLAICAARLPDGSGLEVLRLARLARADLPVLLMVERPDRELALRSLQAGAVDCVSADAPTIAMLPTLVERCLARQRFRRTRHRELHDSLAAIEAKHQACRDVIRELEHLARTDELTGLFNRRWLNLTLQGNWAETARLGLPLAFLLIDLDGFKGVNDRLGHQEGDALLQLTGRVLRANCREIDVAGRYGGDEFCVLMPHTELRDAITVAERILGAFKVAVAGSRWSRHRIGMSLGLAHSRLGRPINAEAIVVQADEAMYRAKSLGTNLLAIGRPASVGVATG